MVGGTCNLEEAFFICIRVHVVNFYTNLNFEPDQRNILEKTVFIALYPVFVLEMLLLFNPFGEVRTVPVKSTGKLSPIWVITGISNQKSDSSIWTKPVNKIDVQKIWQKATFTITHTLTSDSF